MRVLKNIRITFAEATQCSEY